MGRFEPHILSKWTLFLARAPTARELPGRHAPAPLCYLWGLRRLKRVIGGVISILHSLLPLSFSFWVDNAKKRVNPRPEARYLAPVRPKAWIPTARDGRKWGHLTLAHQMTFFFKTAIFMG